MRVATGGVFLWLLLFFLASMADGTAMAHGKTTAAHKNAYATMMYMGTPRDYEFYVAIRVMLRSLTKLGADADLVVIASDDVPLRWVRALEEEDGAKVVTVKNVKNPYKNLASFNKRFKLTLNKLYAWSLVDYERVVMLDADNLFLQNTDELFQCGHFCAVFINPCIFHTGLFVLQPSTAVFKDMMHEVEIERHNPDGADQGFICSYFPDLLDRPMFHPPANGSKLQGSYRLPLGYQMDASYYLWTKQRYYFPECTIVEAMVLVVLACSSSWLSMARTTPEFARVKFWIIALCKTSNFESSKLLFSIHFPACFHASLFLPCLDLGILLKSNLCRSKKAIGSNSPFS